MSGPLAAFADGREGLLPTQTRRACYLEDSPDVRLWTGEYNGVTEFIPRLNENGDPELPIQLAPVSVGASSRRSDCYFGPLHDLHTKAHTSFASGTILVRRASVLTSLAMGTAIAAGKGGSMVGAGGLVVSVIVFAVGAVLDWAVTEPYQHGINVNKVGWILMIVGVVGAVVSIIVMVAGNTRRRRTVVDDGQGNVVRRVDSTY